VRVRPAPCQRPAVGLAPVGSRTQLREPEVVGLGGVVQRPHQAPVLVPVGKRRGVKEALAGRVVFMLHRTAHTASLHCCTCLVQHLLHQECCVLQHGAVLCCHLHQPAQAWAASGRAESPAGYGGQWVRYGLVQRGEGGPGGQRGGEAQPVELMELGNDEALREEWQGTAWIRLLQG
jgi:hypothetical protein